jgi:hypothetical protein
VLEWWEGARGDGPDWRELQPEHGRSVRVVSVQPQLLEMQGRSKRLCRCCRCDRWREQDGEDGDGDVMMYRVYCRTVYLAYAWYWKDFSSRGRTDDKRRTRD